MNKSWNTALYIDNEWHHFLDIRRKKQNGRDNSKRVEKPYFHCGPQAERQLKVLSTDLWKEVENSVNSNNSDNDGDNIIDNDNNSNMKVT